LIRTGISRKEAKKEKKQISSLHFPLCRLYLAHIIIQAGINPFVQAYILLCLFAVFA
jgi:hypothetical protein